MVTRLRMGWGDLFDRAGIIREDHQGRPIRNPPRRSFARDGAEPWHTNILRRGWRRLLGRKTPRRTFEPSPQPLDEHAGGASRRCGAAHC